MKYRIRFDELSAGNTVSVLQDVLQEYVTMVAVRHELPHGNPHYHVYVDLSIKENTLRQRFKRKLPDMKASFYSIKKCDDDRVNEYIQYMFNTKHGNQWELVVTHNFDPELITTLQKAAKEISDDYESANKSKTNKGPTIWDIAQELERVITPELELKGLLYVSVGYGRADDFYQDSEREKQQINIYTDNAIKLLRHYKKPFDEFLLRKVISTAMSSHETGVSIMRRKMQRNFCSLY